MSIITFDSYDRSLEVQHYWWRFQNLNQLTRFRRQPIGEGCPKRLTLRGARGGRATN
jgi:hypothetical protein